MLTLKERAQENPWLEKSIAYIEKLVKLRDYQSASKELQYSSRIMKNRLTDRDEELMLENRHFEDSKLSFLRRKSAQGRNSQSQEE